MKSSQKPAPTKKEKGPAVPNPADLPESLKEAGPVQSLPEASAIVKDQAGLRKAMRDDKKKEVAKKEETKAAKKAEREAKDTAKEEKKAAKQALEVAKEALKAAREKTKKPTVKAPAEGEAPKDGQKSKMEDTKTDEQEEQKPQRKRKKTGTAEEVAENEKAVKKSKQGSEKTPAAEGSKSRSAAAGVLKGTPCKIWQGTPAKRKSPTKKEKARQKREEKARASLAKLRRQREILPDELEDLVEPKDESKMSLDNSLAEKGVHLCQYKFINTCACTYMFTSSDLRSYMVPPGPGAPGTATSILVVLSAEQFCIYNSSGDESVKPDASGRCSLTWNKYGDMGKACLEKISVHLIFQQF